MPAGEITAAVVTAAFGILAVCVSKSKCFFRSIDEDGCQWGVAFSDKAIIIDSGRYETVDLGQHDIMIVKK